MAELLLFHHAQGLTAGCHAFAAELRAVGHIVHLPDFDEDSARLLLQRVLRFLAAIG